MNTTVTAMWQKNVYDHVSFLVFDNASLATGAPYFVFSIQCLNCGVFTMAPFPFFLSCDLGKLRSLILLHP